jgi:hypothetical protein
MKVVFRSWSGEHAYDLDHIVHAGLASRAAAAPHDSARRPSAAAAFVGLVAADAAFLGGPEAAPLMGDPDVDGDFD